MMSLLRRFIVEQDGQDLIEYALLTALIGFAGAAAFPVIMTAIATVYGGWETTVNSLWESPNPAGS